MSFTEFGLDERLVQALSDMGITDPTPIQSKAIPPMLEGRDVVARARTGSGKTAAFGLPLLEAVKDGSKAVRGLVLAPTRELAQQVAEEFNKYAARLPVKVLCIYGGTSYNKQLDGLKRGVTIVVGTPGRVLDLIKKRALRIDQVDHFILDEADEMLNMGFLEDVEEIMDHLPEKRRVALFSATMPKPIRRIAESKLNNAIELATEGRMATDHIVQKWMHVPNRHKLDALIRVLTGEPRGTTLVFARTRRSCAEVADALASRGLPVDALHGDLAQGARERVLARLRSKRLDVLIATDVAARGIDVPHITHVVNFDLPDDPEVYTHRIGRTGRAGREGTAIAFVTPGEKGRWSRFQRALKIRIEKVDVPSDADIAQQMRDSIEKSLKAALSNDLTHERALISELSLSLEDIAAAAVHMVAVARGTPLDGPANDEPPHWARRTTRGERVQRDANDPTNEVQLFFPVGTNQNIRPGDLVGAIASESGCDGSQVGRIDIKERVSFVGVPREVADVLLAKHDKLDLRGRPTPVMLARPQQGGGQNRDGGGGGGGGGYRGGGGGGGYRGGGGGGGGYRGGGGGDDDGGERRGKRNFSKSSSRKPGAYKKPGGGGFKSGFKKGGGFKKPRFKKD